MPGLDNINGEAARTGWARPCIIAAVITAGLAIDQGLDFWGQALTSATVWLLFLHWLRRAPATTRIALIACVMYATAGEIFLSLVWGLYDYRLANIPWFVPPGHALLFMLGGLLAARTGTWIVWAVPIATAPFVLLLAITGADTLGPALFALFLACVVLGRARKLYAVMFVVSLAMEVYGTWLGNWTWRSDVPWLGLTTINPPLAAGTFYCILDLLVVRTVAWLRPRPQNRPRLAGALPFSRLFPVWLRAARLWARRARIGAGT